MKVVVAPEWVAREGWLVKRGGLFPTWQRRFFSISRDTLEYYSAPGEKSPKGHVRLTGALVAIDTSTVITAHGCMFTITEAGGVASASTAASSSSSASVGVSAADAVADFNGSAGRGRRAASAAIAPAVSNPSHYRGSSSSSRTYHIAAETPADRSAWVIALRAAVAAADEEYASSNAAAAVMPAPSFQ